MSSKDSAEALVLFIFNVIILLFWSILGQYLWNSHLVPAVPHIQQVTYIQFVCITVLYRVMCK